MILKSLSRTTPTYGQLIDYVFSEKSAIKDDKGMPFMILHNISGHDHIDFIEAFENNEKLRVHHRKGQVMLYHTILSWHQLNTHALNIETLENLGKKYFELRGSNGMYLAGVHADKEHMHMHIIESPLEIYSGRIQRQSKAQFRDMKVRLQEYEQANYDLSESRVNHGSGIPSISDQEYQIERRTGRVSRKHEISNILADCFEHSYSRKEFYENVTNAGLTIYQRNNKATGIEDDFNIRFKTLGFSEDKMLELDQREQKEAEVTDLRLIKPIQPVNERLAQFDKMEHELSLNTEKRELGNGEEKEIELGNENKTLNEMISPPERYDRT